MNHDKVTLYGKMTRSTIMPLSIGRTHGPIRLASGMVEFLSQEGEVERARVEQQYVGEMLEGFRRDETTILWFSVLRCVGTFKLEIGLIFMWQSFVFIPINTFCLGFK